MSCFTVHVSVNSLHEYCCAGLAIENECGLPYGHAASVLDAMCLGTQDAPKRCSASLGTTVTCNQRNGSTLVKFSTDEVCSRLLHR
jgi:hypothetical protein